MKMLGFGQRHVVERRLAAAATSEAGAQDLVAEEREHLDSCAECRRLLEGHRRAERLLRSPWGPVGSAALAGAVPRQALSREGGGRGLGLGARVRPVLAPELAAAVVVGILIAGSLLWLRGQSMGVKPSVSPSAVPSASESARPSVSPSVSPSVGPSATPSEQTGQYPLVEIPEALERPIPLPSGAAIPHSERILGDGDWILVNLEFADQPNGHREQLYAIDIATGTTRHLADHFGEGSVSSGKAAWVDLGCVYAAQEPVGGNADVCTSWKIHLTDLATGSDTVIGSGKVSDRVNTPMNSYGNGEFVSPWASLSPDALAYTTGDLRGGFVMHLRSLSDGTERTFGLGGMVDEMRWTGVGFVWVENADLRSDGLSQGYAGAYYYTSNRLMVLPSGLGTPIELATNPVDLAAGDGRVVWLSEPAEAAGTGELAVWTASGPGWVPTRPLPDLMASRVAVSDGWIGWRPWDMAMDTFVVLRPGDSAPHLVSHCLGMSGGLLFMAKRDPETLAITSISAVRIADLP